MPESFYSVTFVAQHACLLLGVTVTYEKETF